MRRRGGRLKLVVNVSIFPQPTLKKLTYLMSATVFNVEAKNSGQICAGPAEMRLMEVNTAPYTNPGLLG